MLSNALHPQHLAMPSTVSQPAGFASVCPSTVAQHLCTTYFPARQFCRIFRNQAREAIAALSRSPCPAENIHHARQLIKRARATLRLVRTAIGDNAYGHANATLKAAADALDKLRDTEVLAVTLERLIARAKHRSTRQAFESFRALAREQADEAHGTQERDCARSIHLLATAIAHSRDWTICDEWYSVSSALRQLYKRARGAHEMVAGDANDTNLHTLRKRTQCLIAALATTFPQPSHAIERQVQQLTQLSSLLGKDHDMVKLMAVIRSQRRGLARATCSAARAAVKRRRRRLQARVHACAKRLYRPGVQRFARQIGREWQRWDDCSQPSEPPPTANCPLPTSCA